MIHCPRVVVGKIPDLRILVAAFSLSLVLITGCAHTPKTSNDLRTLHDVLNQDVSPTETSSTKANPTTYSEIVVQGIRLKNTQFDFPITINSKVEQWVSYFTGKGRKHFNKYLERSEFFIPYIKPLLKKNDLPEDLVYLAMIESGFNNLARSHAKAVGPWQFISATGRRYGLAVNSWVDQRRNIEMSTIAASQYLKDLYAMFQSWELAAAAYNAGEMKIVRAIKKYKTHDFFELAQHRFLRPETRNYVPKIIAAALIAKNRGQFGFPEQKIKLVDDEVVAGDGELVKVVKNDKPVEDVPAEDVAVQLKDVLTSEGEGQANQVNSEANNHLDTQANNSDSSDDVEEDPRNLISQDRMLASAALTTPPPNQTDADDSNDDVPPAPLAKSIPTPHVNKHGEVGGAELAEFEVQSPADLLKIARAAGLSYQTVKALNPEVLRWCTPPKAKTYLIKLPVTVTDKFLATYNEESFPRRVQFMHYKARKGDSLLKVSRRLGIKADLIADLNGLHVKSRLKRGSMIYLPVPNDHSRTLSSLDLRDPPELRRHHRRSRRHRYYRVSYKERAAARVTRGHRNSEG